MSRPKYFIKTTVKVYGGRTKYEVVKGFSDADSIAKVGSERDATRLCEEFERLTDENADLLAEVERLRKAGDLMEQRLLLWHNDDYSSIWNAAKEGKQP